MDARQVNIVTLSVAVVSHLTINSICLKPLLIIILILLLLLFTLGVNNTDGFKKLRYAMQRSSNGRQSFT